VSIKTKHTGDYIMYFTTYDYPSQFRANVTNFTKRTLKATAKFFSSIGASIVKGQQARADFWMINNMSNKQLKDIGITRGEIKQRFYGTDNKT
tara:strand:+ start:1056 stop:1334 length:279 start_codon:yes stop_codon:yes gene_type:complete